MSTATSAHDTTGLPAFPGRRPAGCPFDPPPAVAEWREGEGLRRVNWNGFSVWAVSRYEDIKTALTHPAVSADTTKELRTPASKGTEKPPQNFLMMDDPEHARLRRMLTKDFTVKRITQMRPRIEEMAHTFIDEMISKGAPADLVPSYALPIPSLVISLLLGVPYEDNKFFQEQSSILVRLDIPKEERHVSSRAVFGYLYELVARKEREPGDDLLSRIIQEHVATGDISRETAAMNGMIMLSAGHETTANMIALGTLALLENPDALARVRDSDDPALVANTVEELLRYLSIVQGAVLRVAAEDVEIGGQLVRAGEGLVINLPSGNRDTAHFADPDAFDIDRNARGHLAFGYGTHQCLGQTLARAELEIALPVLLRRLPELRLAVPREELKFRNEMGTYGVHELPVAW